MEIIKTPFFWAFISMFGLVGANAVVSGKKLGKYPLYGILVVILFDLGRFVLVLPVLQQPRFIWPHIQIIGTIIFVTGLIFCIPAFGISPFTSPNKKINLRKSGLYRITRNPIYFGEILWSLGWAIMFRSTIGVLLTPLWWLALLIHTLIEEESLEREIGQEFYEFKKQTKGRIFPGLPI